MGNKSSKPIKSNKSTKTTKQDKLNKVDNRERQLNCIAGNNMRNNISGDIYKSIIYDIFRFKFPCIYLLKIGGYREYTNVYKFGRTDNFIRRYKEHNKSYNLVLSIIILQYIDNEYLSKAENDIRKYMRDISALIQDEQHNELVSLSDNQIKTLVDIYSEISQKYSVKNNSLQENINELNHQIEILNKNNEIEDLKYNKIILEKDNKILQLEHELFLCRNRY